MKEILHDRYDISASVIRVGALEVLSYLREFAKKQKGRSLPQEINKIIDQLERSRSADFM